MILACLLLCEYGKSKQVFLIPSPGSPCPEETCYTFMQYVNLSIASSCQSSNVAMIFMSGNHILGTDFLIANRSCFSMSAYHDSTSSSSSVMCINSSRIMLSSVETAVISGLSFLNCGGNTARFVNSFILKDSNFVTVMDPHSYSMYRGRAWSVIGSETLTVDNCTFTTNAAYYRGGALYISAVTNVVISLCTFNNNTAAGGGGQGGAVYINAMNSIIKRCTFVNTILQGGGAQGGAIYVSTMNATIYRSVFIDNKVSGGAAEAGAVYVSAIEAFIYMSSFTNNTASGGAAKGGALRVNATNSIISEITFTKNTAWGGAAAGGAVYVSATNSVINGTTFRSNMAIGGAAQGGALYVRAGNSNIHKSMFINNTATHGAPWYINARTSTISHNAIYEGLGIVWQDLTFNTTLYDGACGKKKNRKTINVYSNSVHYMYKQFMTCSQLCVCITIIIVLAGLPVNCHPPQPPINGNVSYITTIEGAQATYQCNNGYIPFGELKTTCCETGQWFPDPMELICTEELRKHM